jgi:hypothetical protein
VSGGEEHSTRSVRRRRVRSDALTGKVLVSRYATYRAQRYFHQKGTQLRCSTEIERITVASFNGLPFWKRAFLTNAVAIVGVFTGFASAGVQLPTILKARIAVFTIALMNFMLLVVRPRIISQKNKGEATAFDGRCGPNGRRCSVVDAGCRRPLAKSSVGLVASPRAERSGRCDKLRFADIEAR